MVSNLNIPKYEDLSVNLENINGPFEKRREKYKNNHGISVILPQQFGK